MEYPIWFNDEQKEAFDKIRKIADSLGSGALFVFDNDTTVLIELPKERASISDWKAIEEINISNSPLLVAFTYPYRSEGGKCYAVK